MYIRTFLSLSFVSLSLGHSPVCAVESAEWISLFDGKSLAGWTPAKENQGSCRVEDGTLVLGGGDRCHLFYTGEVGNHDFKNFQLKLKVMTKPNANSGVYVHVKYQETGWPDSGYEVQVNNSHEDWRKTGSIYGIQDIKESPAQDNEWFEYLITVDGKKITVEVDGKVINEFTETGEMPHLKDSPERKLSSGTIALQAHDPGSTVYYKDIEIKLLP
ncbi:3-keto-disaccharide hydrolase [Bythopirellula polymerisocia]|uniref:3-keto-alpha-glucoside-1,2-lyase/3-keto-2-hydroxy-glucal hydratase domain-containing protein n=1 Tax=Bythopirellula polymerisocia TaxID=2528003 RepID=A0A5C6CT61_9BACT|nr:DUF1080 domain-containing protein [Bythopirellula polymerisocia]TWU28133.1 hypothetical protein Pla144_14200 [Bythopirellula polymerisocia]